MVPGPNPSEKRSLARLRRLGGFALVAVASVAIWVDYSSFRDNTRSLAFANLARVADLKAAELARWRADTIESAAALLREPTLMGGIAQAVALPQSVTSGSALTRRLDEYRLSKRIRDIALVDPKGVQRVQWPLARKTYDDDDPAKISQLLTAEGPVFDDFHGYAPGEESHLATVIPLRTADGGLLGGLILRHAPDDFLQPFLTDWPSTSASAETLLVCTEGGHVGFLRGLRFAKTPAPRSVDPLPMEPSGSRVALGDPSELEGIDYRGHGVLAWRKPVAGSTWAILAKVDATEALAPVRRRFWLSAMANAAILLFGLMRARMRRSEVRAQEATQRAVTAAVRSAQDRRFRKIIENGWDVVMVLDAQWHVTYVSTSVRRVMDLNPETVLGRLFADFVHPADRAGLAAQLTHVIDFPEVACQYEIRLRREVDRWIWVELAATNAMAQDEIRGVILNLRDVSQQKRAEERAARLQRMYVVLMSSNKAITRAQSISALLQRVCEIAVKDGEFALAWVGRVVGDDADVPHRAFHVSHRVAANGDALGFKRQLSGQFAEDFGELGDLLLAGRRFVDNDLRAAKLKSRIWQLAQANEFGAGAMLPLRLRGATFAVLGLFAENAHILDDDEMRLLDELAADLAQAIGVDMRHREGQELEVRAKMEEERMDALVRLSGLAGAMVESELVAWVVEEAERLTGSQFACLYFVAEDQSTILSTYCSDRMRVQLDTGLKSPTTVRAAGVWTATVGERGPVIINDRQVLDKMQEVSPAGLPLNRYLGAPAVQGGLVHLMIGVANKTTEYDEKDARLVGLLAAAAWAAVAQKRQQAALVESEARYRALFEASPQAMWIYDEETLRILLANPAMLQSAGLEMAELGEHTLLDFAPPSTREQLREYLTRPSAHPTRETTWPFSTRTGETRVGHFVARSVEYGGRRAQLVLSQDITEQTHLEEERRAHAEQLRRAMASTISVVQSMGELRDPYTHGHERRVGEIAAAIGQEMGLDADAVQGLRVAGYIHDIGKIGVPSEILAKPGRLSATEMALVRQHPLQGHAILKDLDFPWPVAIVTLQHHERLDGSGYPAGLKGDEVSPQARIVAVADTVEAMSSHRPYRPALGLDAALAEISANRGTLYDPDVVDACTRLFREKKFQIPS